MSPCENLSCFFIELLNDRCALNHFVVYRVELCDDIQSDEIAEYFQNCSLIISTDGFNDVEVVKYLADIRNQSLGERHDAYDDIVLKLIRMVDCVLQHVKSLHLVV